MCLLFTSLDENSVLITNSILDKFLDLDFWTIGVVAFRQNFWNYIRFKSYAEA